MHELQILRYPLIRFKLEAKRFKSLRLVILTATAVIRASSLMKWMLFMRIYEKYTNNCR